MKTTLNKRLIILGMIVIFFTLLMTSFSFPDLFAMLYVPPLIYKGNIYTIVRNNKAICLWLDATWPPLYYLSMGVYINLVKSVGLIREQLFEINPCPVWELILNKSVLFWGKLPFLFLHFFSAYIFQKIFKKNNWLWFMLWLINPIVIFVTFIQGQFDIIPTFFLILSYYFTFSKNPYLTFLSLGVGAAYKFYPFLLVPVFILYFSRDLKKQILYLLLSLAPFILSVIPFFNKDYFSFLAFSENYKMLELGLRVGPFKISYYFISYLLLLIFMLRDKKIDFHKLIKYSFLLLSIYFVFTPNWFVQRALFIMPSLLLLSAFNKNIFRILPFFYFVYFGYVLIFFTGLFDHSLLRPTLNIQTINYLLWPINQLKMIIILVLGSLYAYLIYILITRQSEKKIDLKSTDVLLSFLSLILYLIVIFVLFFISSFS